MTKILLLLAMIFLHIVDDYYLQGWLATGKQKSFWEQNAPDQLYKYDYIMALFMHSFSWAFMIMIIPTINVFVITPTTNINVMTILIISVFIFNLCCHMYIDNLKANKKKINLIIDQSIHLLQIIWTWFTFVVVV